jgi:hypothetical protein
VSCSIKSDESSQTGTGVGIAVGIESSTFNKRFGDPTTFVIFPVEAFVSSSSIISSGVRVL